MLQEAAAAEIAKARDLEPHTVRAVISRLGTKARARVTRERDPKRGTVYKAARSLTD
jgi:predicted transcriptional regulator